MRAISAKLSGKTTLLQSGFVVALNDSEKLHQYEYPKEVKYVIRPKSPKRLYKSCELYQHQ